MATRHTGAVRAAGRYAVALQVGEDGEARAGARRNGTSEARLEARAEIRALPPIIEISDKDYRSFCFPCHELEDANDCNDGY